MDGGEQPSGPDIPFFSGSSPLGDARKDLMEEQGRDLMEEQGKDLMESREADREVEKLMGSILIFSPGTALT